jgi:hypothetical protein
MSAAAHVRADLIRQREQAMAEVDCLQAEIDDCVNQLRKLDFERRRDRLVKAINRLDIALSASS